MEDRDSFPGRNKLFFFVIHFFSHALTPIQLLGIEDKVDGV
jgi:hypothetical protein